MNKIEKSFATVKKMKKSKKQIRFNQVKNMLNIETSGEKVNFQLCFFQETQLDG